MTVGILIFKIIPFLENKKENENIQQNLFNYVKIKRNCYFKISIIFNEK